MNNRPLAKVEICPPRWAVLRTGPLLLLTGALVVFAACQSSGDDNETDVARGIVIVNAPAAGEVRRVFVREGMTVSAGAPVVEIAVRTETPGGVPPPGPTEDPQARARRGIATAQEGIEAARTEVVRTEVEVQRLTPLAASGDVPQAQLDGARAQYERAQQQLRRAQASAQDAQSGLVAARQQPQQFPNSVATTPSPSERLVMAATPSAGTVSAINARVGDRVTAGQPLATLRDEQR
ncbi:MAG: hypothetical protein H0T45_05630 [Pyrinomonadaceae bacterium]|nr:hypothetical protein [Pyrinomonadaceae bacterium]